TCVGHPRMVGVRHEQATAAKDHRTGRPGDACVRAAVHLTVRLAAISVRAHTPTDERHQMPAGEYMEVAHALEQDDPGAWRKTRQANGRPRRAAIVGHLDRGPGIERAVDARHAVRFRRPRDLPEPVAIASLHVGLDGYAVRGLKLLRPDLSAVRCS